MNKSSKKNPAVAFHFEILEERTLLSFHTGPLPALIQQDQAIDNFPYLNGSGESVAIIDQGVDYNSPAFGGIGRGHKIITGYNFVDNNTDPMDVNGHGTGVAGLIGGNEFSLDGANFQGIAPNVSMIALRQDSPQTIKESLDWVIKNRVRYNIVAVNLTDFDGGGSTIEIYSSELATLRAEGVWVSTPVGNHGPADAGYPAADPNLVGVGGIDSVGNFYAPTQLGPNLDILAPASNVTMPYFVPATADAPAVEEYVDFAQGTSWANAQVTGAALLLKQIDPDFTPQQILQILQASGKPILDPTTSTDMPLIQINSAIDLAYTEASDRFANNHSLGTAAALPLRRGAVTEKNLKYLIGRDNYYSFTVTSASKVQINLGYAATALYPQPTTQLLSSSGNLISNVGSSLTRNLSPGTYIIKVHSPVSLSGNYTLSVSTNGSGVAAAPAGNIGISSMAYAPSGQLDYAFYDTVNHDLSFATRTGANWSDTQIIDSSGDDGSFLSLAIDKSGNPGIAYYDATDGALKYAHFNGRRWGVTTVASGGQTGQYVSLAFVGTNPAISYSDGASGDLRIASSNGASWTITNVDARGDMDQSSSLAINPVTGDLTVAYEDSTDGTFRFATQARHNKYASVIVDDSGVGGGYISQAYTGTGRPAFSYFDGTDSDLRYAAFNGRGWATTTVASKRSQGEYTHLYFTNSTLANIVYYSPSSDSVYFASGAIGGWRISTLATGGGADLSSVLAPGGKRTISLFNDAIANVSVTDV